MNILIQKGAGANHYIRMSLANGFKIAGNNVYYWDDEGKSAFDVFAEFPCDLLISSTWQLDRALVKCISNKPGMDVILYSDVHGSLLNGLERDRYPIGIADDNQLKNVETLIKNNSLVQLISNHSDKALKITHDGWFNDFDLLVNSVLVSADVTQYYPRSKDEDYHVQLAYCGGYWPYKSVNIDMYLTPLCYPNTKWKIRLFGNGWNTVNCVSTISNDEAAKYYTNADIVPHMVEPHCSNIYQDLPLRYFEVAACGGFAISCPCVDIRDIFTEDELVVAEGPKDFFEKVVYYLNNPDLTESFRLKSKNKVLYQHTNLHRVKQLLNMIYADTTNIDQCLSQLVFDNSGY